MTMIEMNRKNVKYHELGMMFCESIYLMPEQK